MAPERTGPKRPLVRDSSAHASMQFVSSVMVAQGKSETPRGGVGIKCPERFDSAAQHRLEGL